MTPLAALAKDDMAVADNGGISSIPGGGLMSMSLTEPLAPAGTGSPPAVTGSAVIAVARRCSSVDVSTSAGSEPFVVDLDISFVVWAKLQSLTLGAC